MGKPDAYFLTKGRIFADTAFVSHPHAKQAVERRKDGSIMLPMFAIDDDTRDALEVALVYMADALSDSDYAASTADNETADLSAINSAALRKRIASIERLLSEGA